MLAGPGRADDLTWEARTGGVEGPVLAALKPVSANAVTSKVGDALGSSQRVCSLAAVISLHACASNGTAGGLCCLAW